MGKQIIRKYTYEYILLYIVIMTIELRNGKNEQYCKKHKLSTW